MPVSKKELAQALRECAAKPDWGNKDECPLCILFGRRPQGQNFLYRYCSACAHGTKLFLDCGENSCSAFTPCDGMASALDYFTWIERHTVIDYKNLAYWEAWRSIANQRLLDLADKLEKEER